MARTSGIRTRQADPLKFERYVYRLVFILPRFQTDLRFNGVSPFQSACVRQCDNHHKPRNRKRANLDPVLLRFSRLREPQKF
jgi:hypothetical protein